MESSAFTCSKFTISPSSFLSSHPPPPSLTTTRPTQLTRRIRFGPGFSARIRNSDGPARLKYGAKFAVKFSAVSDGAADAVAPLSSDVIVLGVEGMMCEGCVSSVKRILETQVSSASVNLASKSATIWPVSEAKVATNWQKDLGEALAKHLTSCGFQSNLKDEGATDGVIQS